MNRRVLVIYRGPGRVMRMFDWVFLALIAFTIAVALMAGLPPTWFTVCNAAFAVPIANELIKFYWMKAFFDDDVSSITMSKVDLDRVDVR